MQRIVLLSSLLWWELGTNSLITGPGEWLSYYSDPDPDHFYTLFINVYLISQFMNQACIFSWVTVKVLMNPDMYFLIQN